MDIAIYGYRPLCFDAFLTPENIDNRLNGNQLENLLINISMKQMYLLLNYVFKLLNQSICYFSTHNEHLQLQFENSSPMRYLK